METYRDKKTWKKDPKPHGRKADVGQNFPVNMHKIALKSIHQNCAIHLMQITQKVYIQKVYILYTMSIYILYTMW